VSFILPIILAVLVAPAWLLLLFLPLVLLCLGGSAANKRNGVPPVTPAPRPVLASRRTVMQLIIVMWIVVIAVDLLILLGSWQMGMSQPTYEKNKVIISIIIPAVAGVLTVFKWPKKR
jgi:hypothetical protein